MIDSYDCFGLLGVSISIYSYARVQWRRDFAKDLSYSLLNLASSCLLMVSLFHAWNLSSVVCNLAWMLISMYGVYRCWKYTRRKPLEDA